MGEHLPCKQGVRGSNPLSSTFTIIHSGKVPDNEKSHYTHSGNVYLENFIQRDNNKPFIINKTSNISYDRKIKTQIFADMRDHIEIGSCYKQQKSSCNATHERRKKLSKEERRVDALALRAEERRDKLRKAAVRSKYPMTRRYLNGETRLRRPQSSIRQSITYGREPGELKHLSSRRKRKKHRFR